MQWNGAQHTRAVTGDQKGHVMQKRKVGNGGLEVCAIGLGCCA
jgi:hypothetical protein